MFELGTMMAAGQLADGRQADAGERGMIPSPGSLIRQALALLQAGPVRERRGGHGEWGSAALLR